MNSKISSVLLTGTFLFASAWARAADASNPKSMEDLVHETVAADRRDLKALDAAPGAPAGTCGLSVCTVNEPGDGYVHLRVNGADLYSYAIESDGDSAPMAAASKAADELARAGSCYFLKPPRA